MSPKRNIDFGRQTVKSFLANQKYVIMELLNIYTCSHTAGTYMHFLVWVSDSDAGCTEGAAVAKDGVAVADRRPQSKPDFLLIN